MPIVGFSYKKIEIGRSDLKSGGQISTSLNIKKIEQEKLPIGNSEDVVNFNFEFKIKYGDLGDAIFLGSVLYMENPERVKEIVSSWTDKKQVIPEVMTEVFNFILFKVNILGLELEQEMNLPPHIKLPRVKPEQMNQKNNSEIHEAS